MSKEKEGAVNDPREILSNSVTHLHFHCPFCRGTAIIEEPTEEGQLVLHTMPMCKKFEKLSPLDYITAVRQHFQGN